MKELKFFTLLFILIISLSSCLNTPLMKAVNNNDTKKVNEFLDQGADINERPRHIHFTSYTPLTMAVINKNIEMAKLLLDRGADINFLDRSGYTALMWAAYTGQTEMFKLLLDKGADINLANNYDMQYTALFIAINYANNEIIKQLLERGVVVYPAYIKLAEGNSEIKPDILQKLRETQFKPAQITMYQQGLSLAVIDFEPRGLSLQDAMCLSDLIRTELINTKQFTVIERSAMDEILKEQAFSLSGCTDTSCAVEVGKLLSARKILVGSVELHDNQIFINGRIVDVEKGIAEIAHRESINSIKELDRGATNFVRNLANRINGFPVK